MKEKIQPPEKILTEAADIVHQEAVKALWEAKMQGNAQEAVKVLQFVAGKNSGPEDDADFWQNKKK